jgi:hypothetical protein
MTPFEAGQEVDRKVKHLMAASGIKSYSEALHLVLDDPANEPLAKDYAAIGERVSTYAHRNFDAVRRMVLEF